MQIVTTHKNCDFDGLASVVAVTLLHPDAVAVIPRAVHPNVKAFMWMHKDVFDLRLPREIETDDDLARLLREKGCTGLPVIDSGHLTGVISRRDFKRVRKNNQFAAPVKASIASKVCTISPDKSPTHAVALMVKKDIGRVPVVENDPVIDIVTRSDAMLYFYDVLPE